MAKSNGKVASINLPELCLAKLSSGHTKRLSLDIGGSLAKLAYFTTVPKKRSCVVESTRVTDESCVGGTVYEIGQEEEMREQLHFIKFESKYIETCLDFIQSNLIEAPELMKGKVIKVTGGGAYKYKDLITEKLGVQVDKEDEMECLLKGCNFLLKNIPDEVFMYQRQSSPEYRFQKIHADTIYPYLLVNIGSGVSFIKVESDSKFERIGGTSIGGGTFWGLGSILTKAKNFDELLEIAESGDHRNIDMLVRDIYGGAYSALGLPADLIASSFGKAARSARDRDDPVFKDSDIAKSLLISISNDIGQIAYLSAKLHGLKKIYFGGYFIRGHPMTMHTISFAINYWSKGEIQALFLRHEGYLGAIGAFLKGAEETDAGRYSWGESVLWSENYAGSSGLVSPRAGFIPPNFPRSESATFDMLELDRFSRPLVVCPLLRDPATYRPDTEDLTVNADARSYWLKCFEDATAQFSERAVQSQPSKADAEQRAGKFKKKYLKRLAELRVNPCAYGSLTVRSLLDTREHCLEEFHFVDPYCQQKQQENEQALRLLSSRLSQLDSLNSDDYWMELVTGLLAGNVFDWGAKEVAALLESGQEFGFSHAVSKLQKRPWLFDDFDRWLERLRTGPPHKCAVIFVDNSGVDIILGVIPFARALLKRGTSVILCANSRAVLNDVTYNELTVLAKRVAQLDDEISEALSSSRLLVMESGQGSPCLDLRHTDYDLSEKMKEAGVDLVVLEGMGRAIHTNFSAAFSCEALKVAVLKNEWLAKQLGGKMFDAVFKYETPNCVNISSR